MTNLKAKKKAELLELIEELHMEIACLRAENTVLRASVAVKAVEKDI